MSRSVILIFAPRWISLRKNPGFSWRLALTQLSFLIRRLVRGRRRCMEPIACAMPAVRNRQPGEQVSGTCAIVSADVVITMYYVCAYFQKGPAYANVAFTGPCCGRGDGLGSFRRVPASGPQRTADYRWPQSGYSVRPGNDLSDLTGHREPFARDSTVGREGFDQDRRQTTACEVHRDGSQPVQHG